MHRPLSEFTIDELDQMVSDYFRYQASEEKDLEVIEYINMSHDIPGTPEYHNLTLPTLDQLRDSQ